MLKERMQELGNQIGSAEVAKDKVNVQKLSEEYILLSNQIKNLS
jgi:hypothetical protein